MSEPEPPREGGAHRRAPGNNRGAVLLASLAGIAVAAVLVIFALHLRGEPAKNPDASPSASHRTSSPSATTSAPGESSTNTSATASAPATTPSSAVISPSRSASVSASATATAAGLAPAVDVLNDSRISGLAASAAKHLRSNAWRIDAVGNWRGSSDVPSTTVFYPDGDKAAAQRLASQYGISRVLPAASGLSTSNLTLVLAYDWSGAG
jgi:hypothetical protein